ncbi:hypothetical protein FA15DRAFT_661589 [Coprinopsis marcescibilis]|uniref:Uncharacterized protein n=1 Tax=Coprinopsis marcescibilis TaxID=230819 RepID=A0A5C3KAX6_COPMA|nr:hypothetical protein FA15DRAFT_661589 [Coprinopsis marcescibilis]
MYVETWISKSQRKILRLLGGRYRARSRGDAPRQWECHAHSSWKRLEDKYIISLNANRDWSNTVESMATMEVREGEQYDCTPTVSNFVFGGGEVSASRVLVHWPSTREMAESMINMSKSEAGINFVVATWALRFLISGHTKILQDVLTHLWKELDLTPQQKKLWKNLMVVRVVELLLMCLFVSPVTLFSSKALWQDNRINLIQILKDGKDDWFKVMPNTQQLSNWIPLPRDERRDLMEGPSSLTLRRAFSTPPSSFRMAGHQSTLHWPTGKFNLETW